MQKSLIPTDMKAARAAAEKVLDEVRARGYTPEAVFAIKLALEEALVNAIKHGNRRDPDKKVQLEFSVDADRTVIQISDQGAGFDPDAVPDPTADENLECPSGRGIMLMRAYMDEVAFYRDGAQVRMVKYSQ